MNARSVPFPGGAAPSAQEVDATYSKISWRLLPFLAVLWVLAWLDRVNIGFAKLQMLDDLKFSEAVYGLGAGIFFIGYFLFEVPSNMLLQKIGAKKTVMRIAMGWGIICILQAWVTTPTQFYVLRFLLGAFEAGFYPGVILYLTYWYPSQRRAKAFGTFMSASAIAGVLGGPLAGVIMTWMAGVQGMHGWQWLFIIEGIPSVLAGVLAYFYMTDRPEQAKWLTDADRAIVRQQLELDQKAQGDRHSDWRTLFKNPMVWLVTAVFFCLLCANSTLTFWMPTVIHEAGFSSPMQVGWMAGAIYFLGAAGMIVNGRHSDQRGEVRWHFAGSVLLGAGGMLVLAITMGMGSIPVVLVLTAMALALIGTMSAIPVFWQMPNMLLSGGAAAVGVALINSVANLAGFGAPYLMGLIKASTGKVAPGLYLVAVVEVLAAVLAIIFMARIQRRKGSMANPPA